MFKLEKLINLAHYRIKMILFAKDGHVNQSSIRAFLSNDSALLNASGNRLKAADYH